MTWQSCRLPHMGQSVFSSDFITPRMNRSGEAAVRGGLTGVAFDPVVLLSYLVSGIGGHVRDSRHDVLEVLA